MSENENPKLVTNSKINFFKSNFIIISLIAISLVSFLFRLTQFPFGLPLSFDALHYFLYSVDINFLGQLPSNWTPLNNGWPIFNSLIFSIFQIETVSTLMDVQRLTSVIFSTLTIIPIYFICKKFVSSKFALLGVVIFAFEPRLIINSLIGVTDPLYIFLGTSALALFLQSNQKFILLSFILSSFAILVRGEGLFFFITLSIMFFVKFHHKKKFLISRYVLIFSIFLLIVIPMSLYRVDVDGNDGIFLRTTSSLENISAKTSNTNDDGFNTFLANTFELFIKYLGWVSLPIFIFFIPVGIFLIFKNRTFENHTVILSMAIMSLPALVAYSVPAFDTRYLYFLFPMFCVLSVITTHRLLNQNQNQNLIIFLIIIAIFFTSLLFFDYLKPNYNFENESYEIAQYIVESATGINDYSGSHYILTSQIPETLPITSSVESKIFVLSSDFSSMDEFFSISNSENVSHFVVDKNLSKDSFLYGVFENESNYPFLEKEFDSAERGFDYQVKIFRINYDEIP